MAIPTVGFDPATNPDLRKYKYGGFDPQGIPGYGTPLKRGGFVTIQSKENGETVRRRVSIYPVMYPPSAYGTTTRSLRGT
jgi:hypothetical protein